MSDEYIRKLHLDFYDYIHDNNIIPSIEGNVVIEMSKIIKHSPFLADRLESDFLNVYNVIGNLLNDTFDEPNASKIKAINIIPYKNMKSTAIKDITSETKDRLIKLTGFVLSSTNIHTLKKYHFLCGSCKQRRTGYKKLLRCYCGADYMREDYYIEYQHYRELHFQEQIDGRTFCETINLIMNIKPKAENNFLQFDEYFGNKLEILGLMRLMPVGLTPDHKMKYETFIEVYGIKKVEETQLTKDRIEEAKNFINDNKENIIQICSEHICHGIYGFKYEKQALMLTVTGLDKDGSNLNNRNTQIVTIMYSDAGKGKSEMSKRFLKYMDRSKYIPANSSKAGLVGGIEKTKGGGYVFTMGEIPYCNNSFAILDEIDNLPKEDSDVLLTVISEGLLKITKIKKFEMPIHVNFIIQGNPKNSYFDPMIPFFSQLTLTRPFLDRGEFLIILNDPYDTSNEEETDLFADKVLIKKDERELPDQLIKDVLYIIKNHIPNPILSKEAIERVKKYWKDLKKLRIETQEDKKEDIRPVGARTLVSIAKISMAVARFRINPEVTEADVDLGYKIFYEACIKNLLKNYGGFDSYSVITSDIKGNIITPQNKNQLRIWIEQKLSKMNGGMMDIDELSEIIISQFEFPQNTIDEAIHDLKTKGDVFHPSPHIIKLNR